MTFPDIHIMGFGKMPADCAAILVKNNVSIQGIWETEKSQFSPLEGFAKRVNIPFESSGRADITNFLNSIRKPTVVFSINNNYIFPTQICQIDNIKIVNFHNSLLPCYPGHGRVIPSWIIFNGESRHGVTWHLVSADIDAGNILCQKAFDISEGDTAMKVMMRCISLGIELFSQHWREFINPQYEGNPQGKTHDRIYGSRDIPNHGHINVPWDFMTMSRFLRSMDYGLFKLLPPPKIDLDGSLYAVKSYRIIKKETPITKNEIHITRTSEESASEIKLLYSEGIIKLTLMEEDYGG